MNAKYYNGRSAKFRWNYQGDKHGKILDCTIVGWSYNVKKGNSIQVTVKIGKDEWTVPESWVIVD